MLGLSYGEIFLILGATAALIGPKDLPRVARTAGEGVKYIDADHFSVPQGRRAIEHIAGKESVIAQDGGQSRVGGVEREVAEIFSDIFFLSFANREENPVA